MHVVSSLMHQLEHMSIGCNLFGGACWPIVTNFYWLQTIWWSLLAYCTKFLLAANYLLEPVGLLYQISIGCKLFGGACWPIVPNFYWLQTICWSLLAYCTKFLLAANYLVEPVGLLCQISTGCKVFDINLMDSDGINELERG